MFFDKLCNHLLTLNLMCHKISIELHGCLLVNAAMPAPVIVVIHVITYDMVNMRTI